MEAIVIAFTLKGQDIEFILSQIKKIGETHPHHILIHGFMPRKAVELKGWPTDILDAFDKYFPVQLNMYNQEGPMRQQMAVTASKLNANVLVIGEVKEGVAEEVALYKGLRMNIYHYPEGVDKAPVS